MQVRSLNVHELHAGGPMAREVILFLDHHNAIQSQIAEGFARTFAPDGIDIYSAGAEPTAVHPCVVRVMAEFGIDISDQYAKPLAEVPLDELSMVVTLCPGTVWPDRPPALRQHYCVFQDPDAHAKNPEELLRACSEVRDQLGAILQQYFARRAS